MRRQTALIALIAAALTFSAALVARADVFAQTVEPTPPPPVLAPVADPVAEAQALVDRAEENYQRNLDTVNFIFGFIQVLGVAAGLLFAGSAASNILSASRVLRQAQAKIDELTVATTEYKTLLGEAAKQNESLERGMGILKTQLEEAQELRKHVDRQLELATRALSLSHLGTRQIDLGNMQVARNLFLEALRLDPDNEVFNYFVGDLYLRDGRIDEGKEHLERSINGGSFPAAKATYAYALRLCGDRERIRSIRADYYQRAEKAFLEVSAIDSHLLDISGESAFGALAGLYRREGRIAEAIEWYEHARSITPQNSYPVNNLAILHYRYTGQEGTDRVRGLEYFRESRRKALYLLKITESYWNYFDLITAEAVLSQVSAEQAKVFLDIKERIDRMFELQPPDNDLRKLIRGLNDLANAPNPAPMLQQVIAEVERRMSRSA
ncbi:MAG: hypothetical protein IAE80_11405 [Anaerolinea sp.]|nr:hypothetical protein [Anaerolinea sp.]